MGTILGKWKSVVLELGNGNCDVGGWLARWKWCWWLRGRNWCWRGDIMCAVFAHCLSTSVAFSDTCMNFTIRFSSFVRWIFRRLIMRVLKSQMLNLCWICMVWTWHRRVNNLCQKYEKMHSRYKPPKHANWVFKIIFILNQVWFWKLTSQCTFCTWMWFCEFNKIS